MKVTSKTTKKIDREMILSDPIVCAVLSIEADSLGVTPEEYVDRFLDAFYNKPAEFNVIIEG